MDIGKSIEDKSRETPMRRDVRQLERKKKALNNSLHMVLLGSVTLGPLNSLLEKKQKKKKTGGLFLHMGHLLYTLNERLVLLTMTSSLSMFLWAGVALLPPISTDTSANLHLLLLHLREERGQMKSEKVLKSQKTPLSRPLLC